MNFSDTQLKFSGTIDTRNATHTVYNSDTYEVVQTICYPNIDTLYGPYDNIQEAFDSLQASNKEGNNALVQGKTVGVFTNEGIREYWLKDAMPEDGYTIENLVPKASYAHGLYEDYDISKQITCTSYYLDFVSAEEGTVQVKTGDYIGIDKTLYQIINVEEPTALQNLVDSINNHLQEVPNAKLTITEDQHSAIATISGIHDNIIYYCTDTEGEHKGKIYLNGLPYGGEDLKVGDGLTYNANKELTLTPASGGKLGGIIATQEDKKGDNNFNVSVQKTATPGAAYVNIPNASEENNGLMTKEQAKKLEGKADKSEVDVQTTIQKAQEAVEAKNESVAARDEAVYSKQVITKMLADTPQYEAGMFLAKGSLIIYSDDIYTVLDDVYAEDNIGWTSVEDKVEITTVREFISRINSQTSAQIASLITDTNAAIKNSELATQKALASSAFVGENEVSEFSSSASYRTGDLFCFDNAIYKVLQPLTEQTFESLVEGVDIQKTSLYAELIKITQVVDEEEVVVQLSHYKMDSGKYSNVSLGAGITVTLDINGQESATGITDESGEVRFHVSRGTTYGIVTPDIETEAGITARGMRKSFLATYRQRIVSMVYYDNIHIIKADADGHALVWIQPDDSGVGDDWTHISINMEVTDPATMITKDNSKGIDWIRRNSHRYLTKYQGEFNGRATVAMCQLNDKNSNLYLDGTPAVLDGSQGDVMTHIPPFYAYCNSAAGANVADIWISRTPIRVSGGECYFWDGKKLIGTYEGRLVSKANPSQQITIGTTTLADSIMRSVCNVSEGWLSTGSLSSSNKNIYDASPGESTLSFFNGASHNRGMAENKESGYCVTTWEMQCMMAILFYADYAHTNCQAIVGAGSHGYNRVLGSVTNLLGMKDTDASSVGGQAASNSEPSTNVVYNNINFFGIENWWGGKTEVMGNVIVRSSAYPARMGVTSPFDLSKSERVVNATSINAGYPKKLLFGEHFDIVNAGISGSDSIGFCDYQHFYKSEQPFPRAVYRSYYSANPSGGIACVRANYSVSNAALAIGARLAFIGEINEITDAQAYVALNDKTIEMH